MEYYLICLASANICNLLVQTNANNQLQIYSEQYKVIGPTLKTRLEYAIEQKLALIMLILH